MPYVDLAGLSRYASRQKERLERDCALLRDMQWTRSEKAGAVSLWPVGGTELKPTVDFLFTETPPASGDKGPENPSTITGVSSVNVGRVGKNLLLKVASTQTVGTVAMTPQSDGSYIINGTPSGNVNIAITDCSPEFGTPVYSSVRLNVNKNYTLTATILEGSISGSISVSFGYGSASGQYVAFYFTNGVASYTFNNSYFLDGRFIARIRATSGASFSNAKIVFQLEEGSTATDFEAPMLPADANNTIPLGGTFYGGTLDVASGVMTVTQFGEEFGTILSSKVFVGTLQTNTVAFDIICENRNKGNTSQGIHVSNRFEFEQSNNDYEHFRATGNTSTGSLSLRFFINKSRLDLSNAIEQSNPTDSEWIQAFLAWLANNHIFVVCDLFSPQTVQLFPTSISSLTQTDKYTPRLNTVYTDAQAVQVGYVKSPIRDEYELQQAIVSQGGNV